MMIENTSFEEITPEELTADQAMTIFGADPEYHAMLNDYQRDDDEQG